MRTYFGVPLPDGLLATRVRDGEYRIFTAETQPKTVAVSRIGKGEWVVVGVVPGSTSLQAAIKAAVESLVRERGGV